MRFGEWSRDAGQYSKTSMLRRDLKRLWCFQGNASCTASVNRMAGAPSEAFTVLDVESIGHGVISRRRR